MEIYDIFSSLGRHRRMMALVVLAAVLVAGLCLYTPTGKSRLHTDYAAQTRVMADSASFGLGRVELAQDENALLGGGFDNRALVMSFFVDSDFVLDLIPKKWTDQIVSITTLQLQESSVLQIEVVATTKQGAAELARRVPAALSAYFLQREVAAKIPERQRVDITVVQPGTEPVAKGSKLKGLAILAFLMTLGFGVFLVLARDNLQRARAARKAAAQDPAQDPAEASAEAPADEPSSA